MNILRQSLLILALMAPLAYGQEWSPPVRISDPSEAHIIRILAIGDTLHVVYMDHPLYDWSDWWISYRRSTDAGINWDPPLHLSANCWLVYPLIIGNGSKIMCFWRNQNAEHESTWVTISYDNGQNWTNPQAPDSLNALPIETVSNSGDLINALLTPTLEDSSYQLCNIRSTDFGSTWGGVSPIASFETITGSRDQVSFGDYVHVVCSARHDNQQFYRLYYIKSTDGGVTWSPAEDFFGRDINWTQNPRIAANRSGEVGVSWTRPFDVYIKMSHDNGDSWDTTIQATFDNTISYINHDIIIDRGTTMIAWEDDRFLPYNSAAIFFTKSIDDGQHWDNEYWIDRDSLSYSLDPQLAVSKGRIFVVWHSLYSDQNSTAGYYFSYWPYYGQSVDDDVPIPQNLSLSAYPNPFNSSTTISVNNVTDAEIAIFDITGRQVARLKAEKGQAVWDASAFSSGVYFARAQLHNSTKSIKLILLK